MEVSKKDRELVYARDGRRCADCGGFSMLTIQHRVRRQMGGDKKGLRNKLSNLLTLCHFCNVIIDQNSDREDKAIANGWAIRSWDLDKTEKIAVRYAHGNDYSNEWRYLLDDGTTRLVEAVNHA